MEEYSKPALTYKEQIDLLATRGLVIDSQEEAEMFLSKINYYRLSAYCIPFERKRHDFYPETTFSQIKNLYEFDRELRFLIAEALEIIEISVRTSISYHLVHKYDAFFHEDPSNFYGSLHSDWMGKIHDEIERSRETFIEHYKTKYLGYPALPLWMAVEVMSFGSLSMLYAILLRKDQRAIARIYSLHHSVLKTWLHTFAYVRNVCAHHGRLWNRKLAISMILPKTKEWKDIDGRKLCGVILAIRDFLRMLNIQDKDSNDWVKRIEALFKENRSLFSKSNSFNELVSLIDSPVWK